MKTNDTTNNIPPQQYDTVNFMVSNGRPPPSGSVLLIEDDRILREALSELLGLVGVTCLDTPSGCEGVRLFRQHRQEIDLVIMDMGLSDTNGAAAIQELEAICPDIKVIIISGQEKKKLDHQFAAHPNISVVQKPFDTFGFLYMVQDQLPHPSNPTSPLHSFAHPKREDYKSL